MNRRLVLMGVLTVALTAMSASGTVMSLNSLQEITYEGTPAWEYIYDIHFTPSETALYIFRMKGFDAEFAGTG